VPAAHKWLRDQRWRDQLGPAESNAEIPKKKKKGAPAGWENVYTALGWGETPCAWDLIPADVQQEIIDAVRQESGNNEQDGASVASQHENEAL